ncbi:MAG: thiamine-phosphate kinase [Hyphomicrobiaceae bacterium]
MAREVRLKGEESIVQGFLRPLAAGWPGAFGLSDDCAAVAPAPDHELIVKTDPIRAGVHFFDDDDAGDIAWKALAVNVSDLAAKAARPLAYTLAMSFPEAPTTGWMRSFAAGLEQAQDAFGCHLVGGDTDRAPGPMTLAVTVFGEERCGRMVQRTTCRAGDDVFVSGTLGDAALGLQVRHDQAPQVLSQEQRRHVLQRFLRPQPRLGLRAALRAYATAAMDLSDGLAKDLGRMCRAAQFGARIELASIPLSDAVRTACDAKVDSLKEMISSGDDYEILATVDPGSSDQFATLARAGGISVARIGNIRTDPEMILVDESGHKTDWGTLGYDHF